MKSFVTATNGILLLSLLTILQEQQEIYASTVPMITTASIEDEASGITDSSHRSKSRLLQHVVGRHRRHGRSLRGGGGDGLSITTRTKKRRVQLRVPATGAFVGDDNDEDSSSPSGTRTEKESALQKDDEEEEPITLGTQADPEDAVPAARTTPMEKIDPFSTKEVKEEDEPEVLETQAAPPARTSNKPFAPKEESTTATTSSAATNRRDPASAIMQILQTTKTHQASSAEDPLTRRKP